MKKRLDKLVFEQGLTHSRHAASELIQTGQISVNGIIVTKNSTQITPEAKIEIVGQTAKFVGRGGQKLAAALKQFRISPKDLIVLDVGASTGGFTDCLLQNGAQKVYAVDVGSNQLVSQLKNDERVVSLEQTDIRKIKKMPEEINFAVIDVSFISLELILPAVVNLINKQTKIIALVKPQFETEKHAKNKSGVVNDQTKRENSLEKIKKFCRNINLKIIAEMESPILGGSGNIEYFLLLEK